MNRRPSKYLDEAEPIIKAKAKTMELNDKKMAKGSLSLYTGLAQRVNAFKHDFKSESETYRPSVARMIVRTTM
jgi:hypothetical protein